MTSAAVMAAGMLNQPDVNFHAHTQFVYPVCRILARFLRALHPFPEFQPIRISAGGSAYFAGQLEILVSNSLNSSQTEGVASRVVAL